MVKIKDFTLVSKILGGRAPSCPTQLPPMASSDPVTPVKIFTVRLLLNQAHFYVKVGFITTICLPCYELLAKLLPESRIFLEGAQYAVLYCDIFFLVKLQRMNQIGFAFVKPRVYRHSTLYCLHTVLILVPILSFNFRHNLVKWKELAEENKRKMEEEQQNGPTNN